MKNGDYIALIQIFGIEFDLLDENQQLQEIWALAQILKLTQSKWNFFKTCSCNVAAADLSFHFAKQITYLDSLNNHKQLTQYKQDLEHRQSEGKKEHCYFLIFSNKNKALLVEDIKRSILLSDNATLALKICSEHLTQTVLERRYLLGNNKFTFRPSFIETDNTLIRILTISEFPLVAETGWLNAIVNTTGLACSFPIENISTFAATKLLDRAYAGLDINLSSATQSTAVMDISQQKEQFKALIEEVVSGEDCLKRVTFNLLVSAQSRQELEQKTSQTQRNEKIV